MLDSLLISPLALGLSTEHVCSPKYLLVFL
jgi:hypothetical protein